MLLVRQFGGVNPVRIFVVSQIAAFNADTTDELRYLGKSNLEAVARIMSRLFENYYPFLYLHPHLSSKIKTWR